MKKKRTFNIQHLTSNVQEIGAGPTSGLFLQEESGRKYDFEERLLEFAIAIIKLSEELPSSRAAQHVANQVLRSGTAAYPNHGEAEAAESRDDFVHKMKICLKELRETRRWARLIHRMGWVKGDVSIKCVLRESDELIRIFHSSVQTAQRNALAQKQSQPVRYSSTRSAIPKSLNVER